MNNKKLKATGLGIAAGICLLVVLCGISLALILGCDLLYRLDIELLDIEAYSGYDYDTILRNYKAMIAYLNPFKDVGVFALPDLAVSIVGEIHFADVRNITNGVFLLTAILLLPLIGFFLLIRKYPELKRRSYVAAGVTVLAVPAVVFAAVAADPDWFFVMFHKIFFSNDYWIFDWNADQVIRILPMDFFIHCAIIIALFWVVGSVAMLTKGLRSRS